MTAGRPAGSRELGPLGHHDLCFGCGVANLFGLQMELAPTGAGVSGRVFLKQDHQGPDGTAHPGVVAAALEEAMALAASGEGPPAAPRGLAADLLGPVPVGAFIRIEAAIDRREGDRLDARAVARPVGADGRAVAEARAMFVSPGGEPPPAR